MNIAVYGASGHTGRFVVAELLRRGHTPIAIGRDASKMAAATPHGERLDVRIAALDSAESLDRALRGADAVINCAGPFLDTAVPVIEAALRNHAHYFDVTAEQGSALSTFERFDTPAREHGIVVVPAAGFYGGLGDVLATHAMDGWTQADRVDIAIALDSWRPTLGTRRTGQRNTAPRLRLSEGVLKPLQPSSPGPWSFPEPFGAQEMAEVPFSEMVLLERHLRVREAHNYLNQAPLGDLRNPETPAPAASDERGRSDQRFVIEAVVRSGDRERRATAAGRDIYAVTAPIVIEAAERTLRNLSQRGGAFALGQLVDPSDFLQALESIGEITLTSVLERI